MTDPTADDETPGPARPTARRTSRRRPPSGGASRSGGRRPSAGPPRRSRPAAPPGGGRQKRQASQRTSLVVLSVLTVVVVAVAIGAFLLGTGPRPGPGTGPTTTVGDTPATVPDAALTTFRDDQSGFSVRYPKAWEQLEPPDANVRLVARIAEGEGFSVRVQRFEQPTTPENVDNVKEFCRAVVTSNRSARILREAPITLDGMPGFHYLYTYADASGQEGVHSHYFLFRGRKANQLVFQAVPATDFDALAGVFDQVTQSFKSDADS